MKSPYRLLGLVTACLAACLSLNAQTTKDPEWSVSPGNRPSTQPTPYINSVAITGDGSTIVGGTFFHDYGSSAVLSEKGNGDAAKNDQWGIFGIYCYDQNKKPLWSDEFKAWQGVYWVDIAQNGTYAAAGGWLSETDNKVYVGFVNVYDAKTGARLLQNLTGKRVNQVQFSADGSWLISAAESLILYKNSGSTAAVSDTFPLSSKTDYVVTADISQDGSTIVCATYGGSIFGFKNQNGKLVQIGSFAYPTNTSCHMLHVDATGSSFVAGGPSGKIYYFKMADLAKQTPTVTFQTDSKGSVYGVAIAADGSAFVGLVNSGQAGLAYFVKNDGTKLWQNPVALHHNPNCASLNLAHDMLAIADGHPDNTPGTFYLFDAKAGTERWEYTVDNMSWPIAISADGSAIVSGSDTSYIYFFRP